jgi:hypothetical protein
MVYQVTVENVSKNTIKTTIENQTKERKYYILQKIITGYIKKRSLIAWKKKEKRNLSIRKKYRIKHLMKWIFLIMMMSWRNVKKGSLRTVIS